MSQQNKRPDQDPAEGSREVVDRELQRNRNDDEPGADAETRKRARRQIEEQVREETELPQKGSA